MDKCMQKRGQVSVFAIVGIIIVILVALFFFLRNEYGLFVTPSTFLGEKAGPIRADLKNCIDESVNSSLDTFSKQGGYFIPASYKFYKSRAVTYYCRNILGKEECLNVMPQLSELIGMLNSKIQSDVNNCVDKSLVKSGFGYEVRAGKVTTRLETGSTGLMIRAHYDVNITKGEVKQKVDDVVVSYDAPIEELYSVAVDIVNSEANVGFFEQLLYMVAKRGQYVVTLDKPYPDKIYTIKKRGSNFEFWFAIQGEENRI